MIITISGLHKSFGARDLFVDAEMHVAARDRVALVGPNGSGKTTLFEMIAGDQPSDAGSIKLRSGAILGLLRQDTDLLRGRTLVEEVLSVASDVTAAGHRLEVLQGEIEDSSGPERDALIAEYGRLQDRFATLGGYALEATAQKILAGLGFADADRDRPTETFSGGWLMRIALAKLLLANPDVLMLDEPTNHLDLDSVAWLESYLSSYEGAVLLISHDRDLIDGIATKVVEVFDRRLVSYTGNFQDFIRQREERVQQAAAAAKHRRRQVAHTERFVERFRYKASKARQVQSRIKALERMEPISDPARRDRVMKVGFPPAPRSGRVVLEFEGAAFGYSDRLIYDDLNLAVERGDKLALVGPNGAGKTTLLRLAAGVLEPSEGTRRLGHRVSVGYFAQHQIEALTDSNTILQELQTAVPAGAPVKPRDLLGRFLFSGDDVDKPVAVLSGGERTRLALAKLLVSPVNLLCLDEPTNHLDMQSRDVLEEALTAFDGSIVLITHDRHLIRNVATRVVEVGRGGVAEHPDLDSYAGHRDRPWETPKRTSAARMETSPKERRRASAQQRARTSELRKRVAAIEKELDALHKDESTLEETMADPTIYSSGADVRDLVRSYDEVRSRRERLEHEWEQLAPQLEEPGRNV